MKASPFTLLLVLGLVLVTVQAWTKEDHEIFRLRDEVIEAEGPDTTFYNLLGIQISASQAELKSALRKKSIKLHPDKAIPSLVEKHQASKRAGAKSSSKNSKPGVRVQKGISEKERARITQEANERYARLKNVQNVLQGEGRERYDHFLKNGFPTWKGTGYYYARFRPGLGSVLVGLLVVFGGFAHYGAMYISWKRQREFVQRYVSHARKMAWGNANGVPGIPGMGNGAAPVAAEPPVEDDEQFAGPLNRKQKRMQEKESKKKENGRAVKTARSKGISKPVDGQALEGPQGSRKKVVAENGKVLIVDSMGDVYLEQETAEGERHEYLLDPEGIPKPTIMQTALFRLPIWTFNQTVGRAIDRVRGTSEMSEQGFLDEDDDLTTQITPSADDGAAIQTAASINPHDETKKRKARAR